MKKSIMAIILFVLLLESLTFQAFALPTIQDSWATKEPLPLQTSEGIITVNDMIYAFAGTGHYNGTNYYHNAVLEYNPANDMWTAKKPMPTARGEIALAVCQNKIYVIGEASLLSQVYDPATDTWEDMPTSPTFRDGFDANVVNGKIYVIGGSLGMEVTAVNEVYDPSNYSWTNKTSMPIGVCNYASAVVDNKIYILGGYSSISAGACNLTQIYDTETDIWSFGTPFPTPVNNAEAGAASGIFAPKRIYVMGGINHSLDVISANQVYNPQNDSWTVGASMPTARYSLHIAVLKDLLFVMGGFPSYGTGEDCLVNEQYTPIEYGIPTASPQFTLPPQLQPSQPLPIGWIAVAVLSIAIVVLVLFVFYKKRALARLQ